MWKRGKVNFETILCNAIVKAKILLECHWFYIFDLSPLTEAGNKLFLERLPDTTIKTNHYLYYSSTLFYTAVWYKASSFFITCKVIPVNLSFFLIGHSWQSGYSYADDVTSRCIIYVSNILEDGLGVGFIRSVIRLVSGCVISYLPPGLE